jgi:hypothetical protein
MNKGGLICTVFTSGEIPENLYLPPQVKNHPFDYLTLAKGKFNTSASRLEIVNLFLHVSNMTGIQYYSVVRNRRETLIEQSYTLTDTILSRIKKDTVLTSLPEQISQFIFQKDNKSSGVFYEIIIQNNQDASLTYLQRNIKSFTRFFIFKINENDLFRIIRIFPCKGGYYYYVAIRIKLPFGVPTKSTAKQSFTNRTKAIIEYYKAGLRK